VGEGRLLDDWGGKSTFQRYQSTTLGLSHVQHGVQRGEKRHPVNSSGELGNRHELGRFIGGKKGSSARRGGKFAIGNLKRRGADDIGGRNITLIRYEYYCLRENATKRGGGKKCPNTKLTWAHESKKRKKTATCWQKKSFRRSH